MLSVEEGILNAIINLCQNNDFLEVRRWIERNFLTQAIRNNVQRDEVLLRQGQGRAILLDEIAKTFDERQARVTLEQLKNNR
ncbi:MAG: hypothetical protein L3V56_02325 [Candidatus Magnetoovum sp. WYHC-5]|nr:hypothetical protein [Candidatus Magnetoovum sp. WYHC-5]